MKSSGFKQLVILVTVGVLSLGPAVGAWAVGDELETLVLDVEGMWARNCEEYIAESLLGNLDGIESIEADHDGDRVTVVFDPSVISADRIAGEIDDCHFFDVTGSDTHAIDDDILDRGRSRHCC